MRIVDRRSFLIGLAMVLAFAAVLVLGLIPLFEGKTVLHKADEIFNGLAKGSARLANDVPQKAKHFLGQQFAVTMDLRRCPQAMELLLTQAGCAIDRQSDPPTVRGDLGRLAGAVVADADDMYENRGEAIRRRYSLPEREALYYWWVLLEQMAGKLKAQGRAEEADLVLGLMTQCVEPGYNFYKVQADRVGHCPLLVACLLVFYVAYTVWYGSAIYLIFRGLGLRAGRPGKRASAHAARG